MGRPYASELAALRATYAYALGRDVHDLRQAVRTASHLPLLAIGSGGSLTTAHFLATVHETLAGRLARQATPLDLAGHDFLNPELSLWLLTAGGSNPDILRALEEGIRQEPRQLVALSARTGSRLRQLASKHAYVHVIDFDVPAGKDGFLATNSLLASVTLLGRAYAESFAPCEHLPQDMDDLLSVPGDGSDLLARLRSLCQPLWGRETLLLLHGPGTSAAAIDLESKFNEAALGHVQVADYRNFGHGRHHWLARRGATTAILAFETEADAALADRTLRLIPSEVAVARLRVPGGFICTQVGAVLASILVAGLAGEARGIDPGRPGVPPFGSRLYRLRLGRISTGSPFPKRIPSLEAAAIERKANASIGSLHCRGELAEWRRAFAEFRKRLESARFGAVVLDYDGTVVDEAHRWEPPRTEIAEELQRLLATGLLVGIATGRGGSAREDLRRIIRPDLWPQVLMGYYNGADVGRLDDDRHPDQTRGSCDELARVVDLIQGDAYLSAACSCRKRKWQITVESVIPGATVRVWERIHQLANAHEGNEVMVLRSGHSVDIIPANVTKRRVVERLRKMLPPGAAILCIGDRGCWPGNDFALLNDPYGLSVHEVSADRATCWNVAPRGSRGVNATIAYLRALQPEQGRKGSILRFRMALVRQK